jgi:general secretion pathway protein E
MTPDVKRFVVEKYEIVPLTQAGYKAGMRPLRVAGAAKIAQGLTTFDEVLKAAPLV